jgi:hypothetical protein
MSAAFERQDWPVSWISPKVMRSIGTVKIDRQGLGHQEESLGFNTDFHGLRHRFQGKLRNCQAHSAVAWSAELAVLGVSRG